MAQVIHNQMVTLEDLEQRMESAESTVYDCLREIQARGLYAEAGYGSFEQYCRERWGFSKTHAHRLINYSKIVERLKNDGAEVIPTEGQARPVMQLARMTKSEDEFLDKASNALRIATDTAPKKFDVPQVTAKHVESTMAQFNIRGRSSKTKKDIANDEIKSFCVKIRQSEFYKVGDGEKFIKKHGTSGFPEDFLDIVDLFTDVAQHL